MCGIFGFTGPKIAGLADQMLASIRHRGPDDSGLYSDSDLSMGMARLSIIDLKGGHQPMAGPDANVWVVFNGEIYNYLELRKDLEAKGYRFKTQSDTETILHAYQAYGPAFVHKLNGMFAIALWDKKKKQLSLIRDRFGVKPLFYATFQDGLIFGSEIKALLCHPLMKREIDPEALSYYLSLRNVPSPLTIYKNIRSLPPGHRLIWEPGGVKMEAWYQLPMVVRWSDQDENVLIDKIEELLQDAVRLRLRSDVHYGAYLSGGVDSSTIVALMRRFTNGPLKTFCLAYGDSPEHKRDAYYARKVAERYGTDHHEYVMEDSELAKDILQIIRQLDQPFAGVISSFWLSRFIKQHVTVALSGDGADDIFGSYGHHRLVGPIAAIQEARRSGKSFEQIDFGFFKDRKEWVQGLAAKEPWEWRLEYAAFPEEEKREILSSEGRELFGDYSAALFLKKSYQKSGSSVDPLNRLLYLDIQTLLPNEILYYEDMLSMVHAVEVRSPFLDYRIVEFANSIPGTLKIKNNVLKYILRRVASRYLPAEVLERPKEGFVLPKNTWLRQGLAPLLKSVLASERLKIHGYFDAAAVESLVKRFQAGEDALTFRVWTLMVFQLWYENVFQNEVSPAQKNLVF